MSGAFGARHCAAQLTAFDRGRKAGQEGEGVEATNPYAPGSPDFRNYELGRGFGTRDAVERRDFKAARPEASAPDPDETED